MTKTTMKAAAFTQKNGKIEIIELPIPEPTQGWIRIKVHACGVCQGENVCKHGVMGNSFPRVPGHEVVGEIDKLGEGVCNEEYKIGEFVGVGWFGGNQCGKCETCLENEWKHCKKVNTCGVTYDGGYAEYMIAPISALVKIPKGMDPLEAAPLLCAGVTVYNSFRHQDIKVGSLVGVTGIGGLGHYAIQFCKKMGYQVIAMSSGNSKEQLSKELGADYYVDMSKDNYIQEIQSIGSVKCILATAPIASTVQGLLESLGINGKLVILAAFHEPFHADSLTMIGGSKSIVGWASGDNRDSLDTLNFARNNNIKSLVNTFPLEKANEAFENIGQAKFRHVIKLL
ncbi:zinc-containing alcohol dehydrogenase [Dictyostelium discoideum AX4]|uniref:Zinc-containing alcohol dehydrogenase n=1 Tax=Dictyostelium discoideum TaxID=44689 RepID=Q556G1_DICDI|nr:zinc-containing alcohol dehydrogenase [Dictyostelium discoideum AX4]XP_645012.1 zinc-containing alcohol dehydrogenase [Dictyostelium discoideum AX4]EAL70476.1 zinc-containing alcohol dehydrogenase [Dictyostelium discoideum AX4]EAL70951.1 zinc-containing alcohol dehydrogenase [Dictyostelium discoideum AX4]|eukprot:XP_644401.1 zinc-containing alcohol dehydrogenase [Dictyostelium discoideum AX4]